MKSLFFKRLGAYLFDFFIVVLIISVITMGFKRDTKIFNRMEYLLTDVSNGKISIEEYTDELFELNYGYQKSMLPNSIVSVIVNIGYFIIFAYLNKGQTIGKKIFGIRVVNKEDKKPSLLNMIGRSIPLYGILTGIINIFGVLMLSIKGFNYTSTFVNYGYYFFVIVCFFMVMYKKDNRGLHDIIGSTYVKEKVK